MKLIQWSKNNPFVFLFGIILAFLILSLIILPLLFGTGIKKIHQQKNTDGFENLDEHSIEASLKNLLSGYFPSLDKNVISDNSTYNIWQNYPIFKVGSYEQTTNNIRYPKSPDEGTCTRPEFCGSFYKNMDPVPTNTVEELQPAEECANKTRVNIYNSDQNMLLRYINYGGNVLY